MFVSPFIYDLIIIGGGIHGCGCAADAATRGLSVLLCEQDDIASKTSSSSSKLIHGGLRYLEHYELGLVKKSLDEQQILRDIAPHLVHPLAFVLPHDKLSRPRWLLRSGLFLYDHLSQTNNLPNTQYVDRIHQPTLFDPLNMSLTDGFIFYDCKTDDARLTLANALLAKQQGADILPQTALTHALVNAGIWQLTLQPKCGDPIQVQARALINATGPWVQSVNQLLKTPLRYNVSLVKGSHLVIHSLYEGEHGYLLQHKDKRVIFVIPYHGYTLVGTTDQIYTDDLSHMTIAPAEVDYLGDMIKQYFNKPFNKSDLIQTWSGVRSLLSSPDGKDASELSRDYVFDYSDTLAPIITIYSGKLTTYRQLAALAVDKLQAVFKELAPSSSKNTPLPGATHLNMNFDAYQRYAYEKYHWLDDTILKHYLQTYGTLTEHILHACTQPSDLGIAFTELLYEIEVDYLIREEWARCADDILWRRTKLGLGISQEAYQTLHDYCLINQQIHSTKNVP